jgi:hypothetical protein
MATSPSTTQAIPSRHAQGRATASDIDIYLAPIAESDRLSLAKYVLIGVAVLLLLGGATFILIADAGKGQKVFDACITILPPIATLIIGYYFAERKQ